MELTDRQRNNKLVHATKQTNSIINIVPALLVNRPTSNINVAMLNYVMYTLGYFVINECSTRLGVLENIGPSHRNCSGIRLALLLVTFGIDVAILRYAQGAYI